MQSGPKLFCYPQNDGTCYSSSQNTTLNNGTLTSSTGYSATDHFSSNLLSSLSSRHLKLDLDTNFLSHCSSDFHFFKIGNPILQKSQVPRSSGCPVRVYTKSGSPSQPRFLPKKKQTRSCLMPVYDRPADFESHPQVTCFRFWHIAHCAQVYPSFSTQMY